MKHKLVVLLCTLALISLPISVMAQGVANHQQNTTPTSKQDTHSGSKGSIDGAKEGSQGIIGKKMDAYYENPDNQPGLLERNVSDVLIGTANFLIQSFGMKDVTLLVFNKNPNPTSDGFLEGDGTQDNLYLSVFNEGMMNAVNALYSAFEHFMPYPIVIIVMVLAFLSLWNSTQAEKRSQWKDYVTAFLVALLSIRFGYYIWEFVAATVETFNNLIWNTLVDHGVHMDKFLNMIWGNGAEGYGEMIKYRGFVVGILVLLAAIMTAILNYQYTMRTIMLMILVSTFVVSAVLTIFPKFRHSLQTWWDLFWSHMIMPCAHALALGLFFLLLRYSSDGMSNWIIVAYLFGFSGIYTLVNKLLGGQDQQRSGLGSMFGVGSMMALGRMFRSKDSGKKTKGAKDTGQGQQSGSGAEGHSSESGEGVTTGQASATNRSTPTWQRRATQSGGKVAGFALNYGAKAAGTVAGTSIGLMAGNPLVGAAVGAKVGGWAGKGTELLAKGGINASKAAVHGIQNWRQQRQAAHTVSSTPKMPQTSNEAAQSQSTVPGHHTLQPSQGGGNPFRSGSSQSTSSGSSGAAPFVTIPTLSQKSTAVSGHVPVTKKTQSETGHHSLSTPLPNSKEQKRNVTAPQSFTKSAPVIFSPGKSQGHIPLTSKKPDSEVRPDNATIPSFLKRKQPAQSEDNNSITQEPTRPIPSTRDNSQAEELPPPTGRSTRHYNYDL